MEGGLVVVVVVVAASVIIVIRGPLFIAARSFFENEFPDGVAVHGH